MPYHLIKCRRSHSTKGTAACRFNASHIYRTEELEQHESECPDRAMIESFIKKMAKEAEAEDAYKRERDQDDEDYWGEQSEKTSGFVSMDGTSRSMSRTSLHSVPSASTLDSKPLDKGIDVVHDDSSWDEVSSYLIFFTEHLLNGKLLN